MPNGSGEPDYLDLARQTAAGSNWVSILLITTVKREAEGVAQAEAMAIAAMYDSGLGHGVRWTTLVSGSSVTIIAATLTPNRAANDKLINDIRGRPDIASVQDYLVVNATHWSEVDRNLVEPRQQPLEKTQNGWP